MKISAFVALGVIAVAAATPSRAGYVGFDSLPAGTIVTNQYASQGIIFTPAGSPYSSRVTDVSLPEYGTAPFSNSQPNALFIAIPPADSVSFHFESGSSAACTSFVNLRAGDGDAASETFRVQMYDCAGNEVYNNVFTTTGGSSLGVANITFSGQIQLVKVSAVSGSVSGMLIDDIEFGLVEACDSPEPGSLLLLGSGVIAVLMRRRFSGTSQGFGSRCRLG
ncbi:MAG: PEP-CTERM sorting domain-containing protein [Acidobacteria bacterium]|nr:PEP-CTERM sorting domain-containing protein [Acidobacteriota bacterium]